MGLYSEENIRIFKNIFVNQGSSTPQVLKQKTGSPTMKRNFLIIITLWQLNSSETVCQMRTFHLSFFPLICTTLYYYYCFATWVPLLLFVPAMTNQRKLLVLVISNTYMCYQKASMKDQKNSLFSILNSCFCHLRDTIDYVPINSKFQPPAFPPTPGPSSKAWALNFWRLVHSNPHPLRPK